MKKSFFRECEEWWQFRLDKLSLFSQSLYKKGETKQAINEFQTYQCIAVSTLYIFALDSIYRIQTDTQQDINESLMSVEQWENGKFKNLFFYLHQSQLIMTKDILSKLVTKYPDLFKNERLQKLLLTC
mmetsp:Transcript_44524/g.32629  ORF Transcript_44524/g.32629 Transcript_44524/m.32629 type:complete len:128 (-) Transcript_44524:412-795(-)